MKIRYTITLSLVLLIGYIGYTIQTQKGAYASEYNPTPRTSSHVSKSQNATRDSINRYNEVADFVSEYSEYFQSQFDSLHSVGGAMTIVYKGQVVFCKPYGVKRAGTHDSVNVHTLFRLASVSKGFAGVLAAKMTEREAINLDTPIIAYLPSLNLSKTYNEEHVTLRNVLTHTSGLLAYSFDPSVESGMSMHQIYQKLDAAKIDANPGQHYAYQNVMFSLLDTVLQLRTGMTYGDLMSEFIFQPLGMQDASVGFNGFVDSKNYAYPHKMVSAKTLSYRVCELNDRYYTTAPAAGVNASISDMGIWLNAILGNYPRVVSPNALKEISTPYVHIPQKSARYWGPDLQSKDYSMGWRIYTYKNEKILYHGGFVQGYRAEVVVWPEKQIAMAMLLNSPNCLAQKAAPIFVNMYSKYLNPIARIDSTSTTTMNF